MGASWGKRVLHPKYTAYKQLRANSPRGPRLPAFVVGRRVVAGVAAPGFVPIIYQYQYRYINTCSIPITRHSIAHGLSHGDFNGHSVKSLCELGRVGLRQQFIIAVLW